jgi:hypothetical protein
MSADDLEDKIQAERPPVALNTFDRAALTYAKARLRAMIDRRGDKLNEVARELEELRREMHALEDLERKLKGEASQF